jgi:hypothetical protein
MHQSITLSPHLKTYRANAQTFWWLRVPPYCALIALLHGQKAH